MRTTDPDTPPLFIFTDQSKGGPLGWYCTVPCKLKAVSAYNKPAKWRKVLHVRFSLIHRCV